jgi:hypothetical protein
MGITLDIVERPGSLSKFHLKERIYHCLLKYDLSIDTTERKNS